MKYLSELPAHDPKIYRMDYTGRLETAPPELWVDEHGYVDIEQILHKKILKYEREIVNLETPGWIEKQRLAFDDAYQKPKHVYISSQLEKIEKEKADWVREDHRDIATKAAESLGDKKAHDVFFRYERWWRHLDNVKSAKQLAETLTDLPHALIDEIEERYGVELIVARAASMYGDTTAGSRTNKLEKQIKENDEYFGKISDKFEARIAELGKRILHRDKVIEELEAEKKDMEHFRNMQSEQIKKLVTEKEKLEAENKKLKDGGSNPSSPTNDDCIGVIEDWEHERKIVKLNQYIKALVDENKKLKQQGEKIMLKPIPAHDPEVYDMDQRKLLKEYGNTFPLKWFIKPDGTLDPHRAETIRKEQFKKNREGAMENIKKQEDLLRDMGRRLTATVVMNREHDKLDKMKAQVASNDRETEAFEKQMEGQAVIRALYVAKKLDDHTAITVLEAEKSKMGAEFSGELVREIEERYGFKLKYVKKSFSTGRSYKPQIDQKPLLEKSELATTIENLEKTISEMEELRDMQVSQNEESLRKIDSLEAENKALKMGQETPVDWKATADERQNIIDELQAEKNNLEQLLTKRLDDLNGLVEDKEKLEKENKILETESDNLRAELKQYIAAVEEEGDSTSGKSADFDSAIGGSNPSSPANSKLAAETPTIKQQGETKMMKPVTTQKPETSETQTHKFKYSHSYISGSHDVLSLKVDIINLATGQSDLKKFSEQLNGVDRCMIVGVQDYSCNSLLVEKTKQPVAYVKADEFTFRDQALIKFIVPHEFREAKELILSFQIQENRDEELRKVDAMETAMWCPPLERPLYMTNIGSDWLIHENDKMFVQGGGRLVMMAPKKTQSETEKLLNELWRHARYFETAKVSAWKKWQKIYDFMMGNRPDVNSAELLAELKKWHNNALEKQKEGTVWQRALDTLPKIIAHLESKK